MMGVTSNLYESKEYSDIREVIKDGINRYPDCVAFTIKNKEGKDIQYTDITYAEFEKEINSLGTGLLKLGLKDKKIAIIGPNSYEWVLSYISVLFGIGIVVPLDKGLPAQEIEDSIIRSDADALIFDPKYIDIIEDIKQRSTTKVKEFICMKEVESKEINNIPKIKKIGKEELDKGNKEFFELKIEPEKTSIILFTSGTTSLSKAVMLSQKNIASNVHSMNAAEKLYNKALSFVSDSDTIVDLYSGTGTITMLLAKKARKVIGIEVVKEAVEDAKNNMLLNHIDNIEFICDKVENKIDTLKETNIDTLIMDPPRGGSDKKTLKSLLEIEPKKIIYISCNPITLARDINVLREKYDIKDVSAFDMFPNTYHVECVCLLELR